MLLFKWLDGCLLAKKSNSVTLALGYRCGPILARPMSEISLLEWRTRHGRLTDHQRPRNHPSEAHWNPENFHSIWRTCHTKQIDFASRWKIKLTLRLDIHFYFFFFIVVFIFRCPTRGQLNDFWKLARFWICIWFAKAWRGPTSIRLSGCLSGHFGWSRSRLVRLSVTVTENKRVGDWDSLTRRLRSFLPLDLWQEIGHWPAKTATNLGNCRYIFQMHSPTPPPQQKCVFVNILSGCFLMNNLWGISVWYPLLLANSICICNWIFTSWFLMLIQNNKSLSVV